MANSGKVGIERSVINKVVKKGAKVGADRAFWETLSQDQEMFQRVVALVQCESAGVEPPKCSAMREMFLQMVALLKGGGSLPMPPEPPLQPKAEQRVIVDYNKDLVGMISEGWYKEVGLDTLCYPIDRNEFGMKEIEVVVISLGRATTTAKILSVFEGFKLRPATLPELLAFGADRCNRRWALNADQADGYQNFGVIALGSSNNKKTWRYPELRIGVKKGNVLRWNLNEVCKAPNQWWGDDFRFLAVCR